jgi:hypothetical protein
LINTEIAYQNTVEFIPKLRAEILRIQLNFGRFLLGLCNEICLLVESIFLPIFLNDVEILPKPIDRFVAKW